MSEGKYNVDYGNYPIDFMSRKGFETFEEALEFVQELRQNGTDLIIFKIRENDGNS